MPAQRLVTMGRSAGSFGLRGEVKISSFAEDHEVFARAGVVYLGAEPGVAKPYRLLGARRHGGRLLMTLEGVTTREDAAALGGAWLYLRREDLPPLADDEFYWFELIGARARTVQGQDLGHVFALTDNGAHDNLVLRGPGGKEAMIPLVEGVLVEMDLAAGMVVVDPPEGLLEAQGWDEP